MQRQKHAAHPWIADGVIDILAISAGLDQAFFAQHAQLLRQRGLLDAGVARQLRHAALSRRERAHQHQALGVGQRAQQARRLVRGGLQPFHLEAGLGVGRPGRRQGNVY